MKQQQKTTTRYKYIISNKEFFKKLGLKGDSNFVRLSPLNDTEVTIETEEIK